ncbi:MAG: flagellar basal body protein [Rickettsiales bacterium]
MMVDVSATALSGLYANEKRLQVAADNIANAQTDGFKAKEVEQSANASGGVTTRVVDKRPATVPTFDEEGNLTERPNVSLEEEIVGAQVATYSAQANIKVLQIQDKMNKYLLDIQA